MVTADTSDGLWEWHLETDHFWISPNSRLLLGYDDSDEVPTTFEKFVSHIHADDARLVRASIVQHLEDKQSLNVEFRLEHRPGVYRPIRWRGEAVRDELGNPVRLVGMLEDVEKRKASERRLSHLAAIVQYSADAILSKKPEGIIESWNSGAEQMFSYEAGEVVGQHVDIIIPEDSRQAHAEMLKRVSAGEVVNHFETSRLTKNGQRIDVSLTLSPIRNKLGKIVGISSVARDITEKKRQQERMYSILNATPTGMLLVNQHGEIVFCNRAAEAMFQYTSDEIDGRPVEVLLPERFRDQHPELRREFFSQPSSRRMGDRRDLHALRRDGTEMPVEIALNPITLDNELFVIGAVVDITARRQAEERLAHYMGELKRSNDELQDFAYISSHDMKSPLRAINFFAERLEEDAGPVLSDEANELIQRIRKRVHGMQRLIDDLLEYSRAGRAGGLPEKVRVTNVVRNVVQILDVPDGFAIEVPSDLPEVFSAIAPLEGVFRNLISNAIKHHHHVREGRVAVSADDSQGEMIEFSVSDDGPGIQGEHHDAIFDAFKTVRPKSETDSTGLGLAYVRKTVESQGGRVWLESEPGNGATFHFTWPKAMRSDKSGENVLSENAGT